MLRFKSFSISDDKGLNELLSKHRLAPGASILVSNGEICVPYEDGEPVPPHQRVIGLLEARNNFLSNIDDITHSQNVLEFLIANAKGRVDEAKANLAEAEAMKGSKEKAVKVRQAEEAIKSAEIALSSLKSQKEMNAHELARLTLNVEQFSEMVRAIEEGRA